MRAVFWDQDIGEQKTIVLTSDQAHHLNNVIRVKIGEEILLLNGRGRKYLARIQSQKKREVILGDLESLNPEEKKYRISLGIAQVKKDAMDAILKASCELGIETIYVIETEFSQRYPLNNERIQKIMVSALEQSNNAYLPEIISVKLAEINFTEFDNIFLFSTKTDTVSKISPLKSKQNNLILIGPEGGFSLSEISPVEALGNSQLINLPTPIMRAPTAVNCAVGYVLSRYDMES